MEPIHSPLQQSYGPPSLSLFVAAIHGKIVGAQHGVREIGQTKAGVGRADLLMRDDCGHFVHSRSAEIVADGDAEKAQFTQPAEER